MLYLALLLGALLALLFLAELLETALAGALLALLFLAELVEAALAAVFLVAGASSPELSEDEELEDTFLAAALLPATGLLAAAPLCFAASAADFPLLLLAFAGGFCACFCMAGSSSELVEASELEELHEDEAAAFWVAGLALAIGLDALGGSSGRLHLLAAGPGTGSACV